MNEPLKNRRNKLGKTQLQISQEVGIDIRQYQYYESGEREPLVSTAKKIAQALGAPIEELFK